MEYEEQPQQQPIQSTPYMAPMHQLGSTVLEITNPENELYKLELTLRNKMLDSEGNERAIGLPTINEQGICSVMGQVQVIVNRVTVLSSLNAKKEIPVLLDYLADCLAKDLMVNARRYELNPQDRDRIYTAVMLSSYICMKRASSEELNDKKFLRGSVQEINTRIDQPNRQGGFLGKIFPGR